MGGFDFLLACFDVICIGHHWFWQLPMSVHWVLAPPVSWCALAHTHTMKCWNYKMIQYNPQSPFGLEVQLVILWAFKVVSAWNDDKALTVILMPMMHCRTQVEKDIWECCIVGVQGPKHGLNTSPGAYPGMNWLLSRKGDFWLPQNKPKAKQHTHMDFLGAKQEVNQANKVSCH